jgi:hypothetical protein
MKQAARVLAVSSGLEVAPAALHRKPGQAVVTGPPVRVAIRELRFGQIWPREDNRHDGMDEPIPAVQRYERANTQPLESLALARFKVVTHDGDQDEALDAMPPQISLNLSQHVDIVIIDQIAMLGAHSSLDFSDYNGRLDAIVQHCDKVNLARLGLELELDSQMTSQCRAG